MSYADPEELNSLRKIRVVHVISRMNVGGPAIIIEQLFSGLDNELFDLILITGKVASNEVNYLSKSKTNFSIHFIENLGRSLGVIKDLKAFLELVKILRELSPDIVHTHSTKAGILARIATKIFVRNAKIVHTFHGHLLYGYFTKPKVFIYIKIEQGLAKITDRILTVGSQVKADLLHFKIGKESKYVVVFPGIKSHPNRVANHNFLHKELKLHSNVLLCTFVGRLTAIKRPDRLIKIAQFLKDTKSNAVVIVVGDGELKIKYENIAKSLHLPIFFLGHRNEIQKIWDESDIAILTSENEGIPVSLIEAAHSGVPIISTNVGSLKDIVIDGSNGYLIEKFDENFSKKLADLLHREELRRDMGLKSSTLANQRFDLDSMLETHSKIYQKL